jgi:olfactory receptor
MGHLGYFCNLAIVNSAAIVLSVISLLYGTGWGVTINTAVTDSSRKTSVASLIYSVVPQQMNPFIYSVRNRDERSLEKT